MCKRIYITFQEAFADIDKMITLGFIASRPVQTPEGAFEVSYL